MSSFRRRPVTVSSLRVTIRIGLLIGNIAAAGSIKNAVALAKANSSHTLKVEVEVEDLEGVSEAVKAGADIIMLDNMDTARMKDAVEMVKDTGILLEASGGINLDTIQNVAKTGVHIISIGALTHSPKAADFSLEIVDA